MTALSPANPPSGQLDLRVALRTSTQPVLGIAMFATKLPAGCQLHSRGHIHHSQCTCCSPGEGGGPSVGAGWLLLQRALHAGYVSGGAYKARNGPNYKPVARVADVHVRVIVHVFWEIPSAALCVFGCKALDGVKSTWS